MASKTYFPNLDGLRFIGAALVVVDHTEHIKSMLGVTHHADLRQWHMLGHLGVLIFFVLSGFLITYLLLEEERNTGRIDFRKFQMRRVLRIWPLYFLAVGLALFVFPYFDVFAFPGVPQADVLSNRPLKLIIYALFLPSLVATLAGSLPLAGHLWTIGTEVYFYFLWPLLLRWSKRNRILMVLLVILANSVVNRTLATGTVQALPFGPTLWMYWSSLTLNSLAIGGLMALLAFRGHPWLRWVVNLPVFGVLLVLVVAGMITGTQGGAATYGVYSLAFGMLILNLAVDPKLRRVFEWNPVRYLGRISYGIYIYHVFIVVLVLNLLVPLLGSGGQLDAVVYPLVFGLTIGVAALSFRYYEGWFQRFRKHFLAR